MLSTWKFIIDCERSGLIFVMIPYYARLFSLERGMHFVPEQIFAHMFLNGPMLAPALPATSFPTALGEG